MITPFGKMKLTNKFLVSIIPLLAGVFVVLALVLTAYQQRIEVRDLKVKGDNLANFLAGISTDPIISYNFVYLKGYVRDISKDPDVASVSIYDREMNLLADKRNNVQSADGLLEVSVPIAWGNNRIGMVKIELTLTNIRRKLHRSESIILTLSLGTMLLISLIVVLFFRSIALPVLGLAELMRRVSRDKDYTARVQVQRQDELGTLAEGFNEMLEQIQERDQELEHHRQTLEQEVMDRTKEVQERQRFLSSVFSSIQDGISVLDKNLNILRVNPAMEHWYGHAMPLVGKKCFAAFHGAREQCALCPSSKTLQTGLTASETVEKIGPDGVRTGWMEVFSYPMKDLTTGQTTGVIEYMRDISDRKRAEDALAEETERLAVTLRSIGDGVITTDVSGRIVLLNKTAEQMTGWSQAEAFGKPLLEVFRVVDERTREKRENPAFLAIRTNSLITLPQPTVLIGKDLTEKIVADSCVPIVNKKSQIIGVVLVFRDITQTRWMEEELRKSQKLESVGVLAGGIAHDFNNILAAINLNIFLVKSTPDLPEKTTQRLEMVELGLGRALDLTHQLLTFSKGGAPIKVTASIAELIRESATFALHGSDVKCIFRIADDLLLAQIDKGQISQAINNLIINAKQAMPGGGTITISAENATIGPQDVRPLQPGAYIVISVADTGTGIDKEQLPRIFDPYFTTKKQGSGLGLAIVFSIVKRHNGYIDVQSRPGAGTTFRMYLPSSEQVVSVGPDRVKPVLLGKGRILVMDDEIMISEALAAALQDLGYDIEISQDGEEAIAAYQKALEAKQPFDLVIMDLTIPGGMGGKEAIKKLLAIDPNVKAVVSSGYSTDAVMANYKEHGFRGVIAKPYNISNLSDLLQALIPASS